MLDQIKKNINIIALVVSVVDTFFTAIGIIGQFIDKPWFWGVYVALFVFLMACLAIMALNKKEDKTIIAGLQEDNATLQSDMDTLEDDITLLRANICSGLKFLSSQVTVEFIKGATKAEHKYKFTFCKECQIIGESKWYSGQVYFNNELLDEVESERYYENNPITWEALNASASIRTFLSDGTYNEHDAEIYAVAKSPRYFRFHIRYGTADGRIDPSQYERFELRYSYEVPVTHWGSYINRTISYFGEPTKVLFRLSPVSSRVRDMKKFAYNFANEVSVYEKNLDADPNLLNYILCKEEQPQDGDRYLTLSVQLPQTRAKKYVVSWDPSVYFGKEFKRTTIARDTAELTAQ